MTKTKRQTPKARKIVVTTLGVFGYISLLIEWLWVVALYAPLLMRSKLRGLFIPQPTHAQPIIQTVKIGGSDVLWLIVGVAVTVIVLIATLVILARLPMAIAKAGNRASEAVAEVALPIITHHHAIAPKKRRWLTAQLVSYAKFSFALLPLLGLIGLWFTSFDVPSDIIVFISVFSALGTIVWFVLEYVLARLLRVPLEEII